MENNRKYQGSFDTRIFWYQYRIDIVWEVATINIPELMIDIEKIKNNTG